MPGIKSITWNDFNDARLLQALCFVTDVSLTEQAAQNVADTMGNGVTSNAIRHRVNTLKKKLRNCNGSQSLSLTSTPQKTPQKRSAPASNKKTQSAKKRKLDDGDSGDDDILNASSTDGPQTPTANTKRARRDTPKKNYAQLDDPYADEVPDDVEDLRAQINDGLPESADEDDFKVDMKSENDNDTESFAGHAS